MLKKILGSGNLPLDPQEGQQGVVRLLIEAKDTVPVHVIIALTVQSVEGEEWWVEPRQQDRKQQGRAAHHDPGREQLFRDL